jgi:hypothetical protein
MKSDEPAVALRIRCGNMLTDIYECKQDDATQRDRALGRFQECQRLTGWTVRAAASATAALARVFDQCER